MQQDNNRRKNIRLAINMAMIVVGMLMMAYAFVPLYRMFCQLTGLDGTPQFATSIPDEIIDRDLEVFLDANVDPRLGWTFRAAANRVNVKIGENKLAFYKAVNTTDKPMTGRSVYNVTPEKAAKYFNKVECFCFINQTIKPGEEVTFPLSFFIDPEFARDRLMDDVEGITLSYTFYLSEEE